MWREQLHGNAQIGTAKSGPRSGDHHRSEGAAGLAGVGFGDERRTEIVRQAEHLQTNHSTAREELDSMHVDIPETM